MGMNNENATSFEEMAKEMEETQETVVDATEATEEVADNQTTENAE